KMSTHKIEVDKETTIEELKILIKELGGRIGKRKIDYIFLIRENGSLRDTLNEEDTLGELGLVGKNARVEHS
ncbi:MAG: hypothetical protein GY931_18825, partial [Maribacter sp.]|nr:hypothetical protein [Maribacter sp.]